MYENEIMRQEAAKFQVKNDFNPDNIARYGFMVSADFEKDPGYAMALANAVEKEGGDPELQHELTKLSDDLSQRGGEVDASARWQEISEKINARFGKKAA